MKTLGSEEFDVETGKFDNEKEKLIRSPRVVQINNQALLSGLAYCLSSCSMILVNKFVLSSYDFSAGISLMLYQNLVSVLIVSMLSTLGVISTELLTWRLIKVWMPVNVIFVGMLVTSMFRRERKAFKGYEQRKKEKSLIAKLQNKKKRVNKIAELEEKV
ncbi:Gdp-mannose transporter gonst1 [Heracleum sosnowskyi]|uniref:Gdp-mannose transporter gonst1 n=1 Tax=Heracleum sosnowskyi TaxID=360622 RepID=A0AAD8N0J9_9APIA|nr:Gdp-mannose transporter gonst1 [Heracleum sosnowskyi]